MLTIGKSYIVRADGMSRLCADLTIGSRRTTLWFGVDSAHEDWLALGRADAFVMALLRGAMQGGHDIVCEDPMSERLHYQLTNGLIPTLAFAGELYHVIKITAPLTAAPYPNQGAVGTGFSGGVDSLYTIMRHGADSECPLTHLTVFDYGNPGKSKDVLKRIFERAKLFGLEQGFQSIFVDANLRDVIPYNGSMPHTFPILSCALALQGLLKTYLLSSAPYSARIDLNLRKVSNYDLLTVNCSSTESLSVYLSGVETTRKGKLTELTQWEPSHRWLNSCIVVDRESHNCGHCKKCIHDMTMLYALGKLEQYRMVYDISDYLKNLSLRIGYILAGSDSSDSCAQAAQLLRERNVPIPQAAYIYEKQFRRARQNQDIIRNKGDQT